jgi:predicted Zn-dependent protease
MLGEIELNEGRHAAALPHLQQAADQRPYDIAVRFMLGQTLRAVGRTDEAKAHLDYVARADEVLNRVERQCREAVLRPADVDLRYEIGTNLLAFGDPQEGIKWLTTVLQLKPDHPATHRALAEYYAAHGDTQRAEQHRQQSGTASSK